MMLYLLQLSVVMAGVEEETAKEAVLLTMVWCPASLMLAARRDLIASLWLVEVQLYYLADSAGLGGLYEHWGLEVMTSGAHRGASLAGTQA